LDGGTTVRAVPRRFLGVVLTMVLAHGVENFAGNGGGAAIRPLENGAVLAAALGPLEQTFTFSNGHVTFEEASQSTKALSYREAGSSACRPRAALK